MALRAWPAHIALLAVAMLFVRPHMAMERTPDALPTPSAADLLCRANNITLTEAMLASTMGVSASGRAQWCVDTNCGEIVAQLNTQLHAAFMDCPLRVAVFLAVRSIRCCPSLHVWGT